MIKVNKINIMLLAACLAALHGCGAPTRPDAVVTETEAAAGETVTITLLSINDFHGGLYERPLADDPSMATGGLPWLAGAVEAVREETGDPILLDAGDMFQGSWPINATFGQGSVEVAELLGVEAAAVGNHEFDYGPGEIPDSFPTTALEEAFAASNFPWLAANIYLEGADAQPTERWQPTNLQPWTVIERRGVRIGIIGLTTTETPLTTQARNVAHMEFADPVETVRELLPEFEAAEVDVVVVLAHLTGECPSPGFLQVSEPCRPDGEIGRLLDELPAGTIDVIVAGHGHALMAHRIDDTFIMGSWDNGRALSRLDLVVGPDGVLLEESTLHEPWVLLHDRVDPGCEPGTYSLEPREVGGRLVQPSAEALELVQSLEARTGSLCDVVGCAAEPLIRSGGAESVVGDLVADALLQSFEGVDVAIQNSGGLRADLPAGPLRREHLFSLMPFDNRLLLVELSGEQLLMMFRIATSGAHGLMQVAGASYSYEPDCGRGSDLDADGEVSNWEANCLCEVRVGSRPVDPEGTYRVVLCDFLYNGGDHLGPIFEGIPVLEEGPLVRDAIISYLSAMDTCVGEMLPTGTPQARIATTTCGP